MKKKLNIEGNVIIFRHYTLFTILLIFRGFSIVPSLQKKKDGIIK